MAMTREELTQSPLPTAALVRMGFDIARLEFYRWLVVNGKHPDYFSVASPECGQFGADLVGSPRKQR